MPIFRDPETYAAYGYLVHACWKEFDEKKGPMPDLRCMAREFADMIRRYASECSVSQAREWCAVLRTVPFARHVTAEWDSTLAAFTARVRKAIGNKHVTRQAEAIQWITFVNENASQSQLDWCCSCLDAARDVRVPFDVAGDAFRVVQEKADGDARQIAAALRELERWELDSEDDVWDWPEFREALWAVLTKQDDSDVLVRGSLARMLDKVKYDVGLYGKWIDVFLRLEALDVAVDDPSAPAAESVAEVKS